MQFDHLLNLSICNINLEKYILDVLSVVFKVSIKLNDTEEISLSEELASRMALIDGNENRVMEEEISCRSNNLNENLFSLSVVDRIVSQYSNRLNLPCS